jgi:hypothetical protein
VTTAGATLLNSTNVPSMLGIGEVQIPEPTTIALLGGALVALARRRRSRK